MTSIEKVGGRSVTITGSLRAMAKLNKSKPVLILDYSGSMANSIHQPGADAPYERKIDALRRLVGNLRLEAQFEQLVFETHCAWQEEIPEPAGGTDLAGALNRVCADRPTTRRCVLITDGRPNNKATALEAGKALPCPLDIFYVGPVTDTSAQLFLKELAEAAGGKFGQADLGGDTEMLENKVRLALKAGEPEDIAKGPIAL
jgi:hypothetical protein